MVRTRHLCQTQRHFSCATPVPSPLGQMLPNVIGGFNAAIDNSAVHRQSVPSKPCKTCVPQLTANGSSKTADPTCLLQRLSFPSLEYVFIPPSSTARPGTAERRLQRRCLENLPSSSTASQQLASHLQRFRGINAQQVFDTSKTTSL